IVGENINPAGELDKPRLELVEPLQGRRPALRQTLRGTARDERVADLLDLLVEERKLRADVGDIRPGGGRARPARRRRGSALLRRCRARKRGEGEKRGQDCGTELAGDIHLEPPAEAAGT